MKLFFKELFEYTHHYNQKLSEVFIENPEKTSEKALKLFSHMLNAHQIWNNRIEPRQSTSGVWELRAIEDFKDIDTSNFEHALHIVDTFDLNENVNYSTSKGQPFSNSIRDILFHIINHSTYHRGQIATEFRLHGMEPLMTDFIFYKMKK